MLSVGLYGSMHRFLGGVASELCAEIGEKVVHERARTLDTLDDASPRR